MKRQTLILAFFALLPLFLFTRSLPAELRLCNGRWTNLPCNGETDRVMEERDSPPRPAGADDADKKSGWLLDLNALRLRAREKYDIQVSISDAEEACRRSETSLDDCRQLINQKEQNINQLMLEHKKIAVDQERNKLEAKKQEAQENNTTQTIIQVVQPTPTPWRRHHGRPQPSPTPFGYVERKPVLGVEKPASGHDSAWRGRKGRAHSEGRGE